MAPDIFRQRLLLEGYYTVPVDRGAVEGFLTGIAGKLRLRTYGAPIVHAPDGIGKPENQGFDAFIPLIDSGISLAPCTTRVDVPNMVRMGPCDGCGEWSETLIMDQQGECP